MVLIDVNEVTGADILARPDKVTNPSVNKLQNIYSCVLIVKH